MTHAMQRLELGAERYVALGRVAREEHVLLTIMKNSHMFNAREIEHVKFYIEWGEYLGTKAGTSPPPGMCRPHAHHGVFAAGRPGPQRRLVHEAQDIVRRRAGVETIWETKNLGWAPNRGHTTAVIEDILKRLRALDSASGTPEDFRRLLRVFLEEAATR